MKDRHSDKSSTGASVEQGIKGARTRCKRGPGHGEYLYGCKNEQT